MARYRNRGTGRVVVVTAGTSDPYLDGLPHRWERLDPLPVGDEPTAPAGPPERPAKRASRAAWAAYAVDRGATDDEVDRMSRNDLVASYGGD